VVTNFRSCLSVISDQSGGFELTRALATEARIFAVAIGVGEVLAHFPSQARMTLLVLWVRQRVGGTAGVAGARFETRGVKREGRETGCLGVASGRSAITSQFAEPF